MVSTENGATNRYPTEVRSQLGTEGCVLHLDVCAMILLVRSWKGHRALGRVVDIIPTDSSIDLLMMVKRELYDATFEP